MGKRVRMTKEERRKQIIKSALKVFIAKGYNGATTLEIAKEAGISEMTLFRYFDSKKEVFVQSVKPLLTEGLKISNKGVEKNLEARTVLESVITERVDFISKNRELIKLVLMESQVNPDLADFNFIDETSRQIREMLKDTATALDFHEESFRLLMGALLTFLYLPQEQEDRDNFINYLTELLTKKEEK